jgi:hypothetical protein
MRLFNAILLASLLIVGSAIAQGDDGFTGVWRFNSSQSEVRYLPVPPDAILKVEQSSNAMTVMASSQEGGPSVATSYPLDGSSLRKQVGEVSMNTATKWEGAALLTNTLVSGPQNYTVMERWTRSRDGSKLTIRRTIVRASGETESTLVYNSGTATAFDRGSNVVISSGPNPRLETAAPRPVVDDLVVAKGTRLLLRLTNAVNTKHTKAGDVLYLETAVPVFVNGRLAVPRGSYVTGTVTDAKESGRVKGRASLQLHFDTITLPNGVARDLRSRPGSVDTHGDLDRKEGKIEGEGNKGGDARTVGQTTAAGAGIGTLAGAASGHYGMGAGIGAAAGAAAGLAGVLSSRGPQVVMPAGTTMELVLDRDLKYSNKELFGR